MAEGWGIAQALIFSSCSLSVKTATWYGKEVGNKSQEHDRAKDCISQARVSGRDASAGCKRLSAEVVTAHLLVFGPTARFLLLFVCQKFTRSLVTKAYEADDADDVGVMCNLLLLSPTRRLQQQLDHSRLVDVSRRRR